MYLCLLLVTLTVPFCFSAVFILSPKKPIPAYKGDSFPLVSFLVSQMLLGTGLMNFVAVAFDANRYLANVPEMLKDEFFPTTLISAASISVIKFGCFSYKLLFFRNLKR